MDPTRAELIVGGLRRLLYGRGSALPALSPGGPLARIGDINLGPPTPGSLIGDGRPGSYKTDLTLQNLLAIGTEFAPADITDLQRRARFGDPRWLFSLYDMMRRLGVGTQFNKVITAIRGATDTWTASPADYDDEDVMEPSPEIGGDPVLARLIRDAVKEAFEPVLADLKRIGGTHLFYGIAAARLTLVPRAGPAIAKRIVPWGISGIESVTAIPQRRFRMDPLSQKWLLTLTPLSFEGVEVGPLVDKGALIWWEEGREEVHLDERGLYFQVLIPWVFVQYLIRWWGRFMEKVSTAPVVGTHKPNDVQTKAALEAAIDRMAADFGVTIPDTADFKFLNLPLTGLRDFHEAAWEWGRRQFDEAILGHSQASGVQVGAGSQASTGDAQELFREITNDRLGPVVNPIQKFVRWFVASEFGPTLAAFYTPTLHSEWQKRDDPSGIAAVGKTLKEAGAGESVAAEDLVRRAGLRIAKPGEKNLGAAPAASAFPGALPGDHPPALPQTGPDGEPLAKEERAQNILDMARARTNRPKAPQGE